MLHPRRKPGESNRKYKHYRVTVTYTDGGTFGREYTDREKAGVGAKGLHFIQIQMEGFRVSRPNNQTQAAT
jgi:hypothetical protein